MKPVYLPRIALTSGEPAGIGPDIVLTLAQRSLAVDLVIFADPELLSQRARQLGLSIHLLMEDERREHQPGYLKVKEIPLRQPVIAGQLNSQNAEYVLQLLQQAAQACVQGEFDALVTAPVHKGIINQAGFAFSGHTEFFAAQTQTPQVVMMLASEQLKVALVTTHLPLHAVSEVITSAHLEQTLRILHRELQLKFALANPRITVCGLNPHAGEGGHLGNEEITVIQPVLAKLIAENMALTGPLPADTVFTPAVLAQTDVVLAMYHDQGLPVLKYQSFGKAVNITLGLPIIRTSVDHGTALSLAGHGQASSESLYQAVQWASQLVKSKRMSENPSLWL